MIVARHDGLLHAVVAAREASPRGCARRSRSSARVHVELDVRRGRDQLQVELALEALLGRCPCAAAPGTRTRNPKPSAMRGLGLVDERRVGELQLVERLAQLRVVATLGREQPGPHHRPGLAVAGQRLGGAGLAVERDRVAHLRLMHVLEAGHEVADLAGAERSRPGVASGAITPVSSASESDAGREHPDPRERRQGLPPARARR